MSLASLRRLLSRIAIVTACLAASVVRASDPALPGPFAPGVTTVTIERPDASTFTAKFYYPATAVGTDAPFDPSGGSYPMIAFGHGFFQQPFRYFGTLGHLATHGYLVIATESETGLLPNHAAMADDMSLTLSYLESRGANPADALFGAVDNGNAGMSGHSMGAGVSLLAAEQDSRVRAVATLAAAITNPSPIPQLPELQIPVALLHGDEDGIVPIESGSIPLYEGATAPRLQPTIEGGFHVGFQDLPFPLFPDSGSLPAADQLAITREYLTSYFDLYLKGDQSQWRNIWGPEAFSQPGLPTAADPGVTLTTLALTEGANSGESVLFQLTVTNTGTFANSFDLFVEDEVWGVDLNSLTTPILNPGESYSVDLSVQLPDTADPGASDEFLVSARSQADLGTRGYIVLTAVAVPEPSTLALTIIGCGVSLAWVLRRNV